MRQQLENLLRQIEGNSSNSKTLRFQFGFLCLQRVEHFLEDEAAKACWREFRQAVSDCPSVDSLAPLAQRAAQIANTHQGSKSLDGVGHAAVSATYALAKAIAGQARQAAEYAAYAAVYGDGGYGATSYPDAFLPEQAWQVAQLTELIANHAAGAPAT